MTRWSGAQKAKVAEAMERKGKRVRRLEGVERRTLLGVLGILRTTVQLAGTHSLIIEMVVPARMEMSSLPSRASDMPGARRRRAASWGLQLRVEGESYGAFV